MSTGSDQPDNQLRMVMIGVGNLMEVLWPAIEPVVGGPDVSERLLGVTMDEADLARKQQVFGFEITLGGNLEALRRNRPDIIMFSPPPPVAPRLIDEVLGPYMADCRAERETSGRPLPVIYAYPPVPLGQAYLDALGDDVLVVNIIPNNVTTIGGEAVVDEGYYVCTFPSPWPPDQLARLQRVFGDQGAFVQLDPDQLIPMLGAATMIFGLWHAVPAITDRLGGSAGPGDVGAADHREAAGLLRQRAGRLTGHQRGPVAAGAGAGDGDLTDARAGLAPEAVTFLDRLIDSWCAGIGDYYDQIGIGEPARSVLIGRGFDLILHTCQVEPREVLHELAVGAATTGGVLERAIIAIDGEILPLVEAGLAQGRAQGSAAADRWSGALRQAITEAAHTVRRHGLTLSG